MAASYTYGLSASDVTGELPGNVASVGAATTPVNTSDITQWIDDASAKMNAMLDKSGIEAGASMDADALSACATAVKSYAIWKTLSVMGVTGPLLDNARRVWTETFAEFSNRPQSLGDAYDDGLTVNIDTDDTSEDWDFINSESSLW